MGYPRTDPPDEGGNTDFFKCWLWKVYLSDWGEQRHYRWNGLSGEKLVHTIHDTHLGNSYMNFAPVEKTIEDGTVGALNRVFKEISE